jgi:hypothetical protein
MKRQKHVSNAEYVSSVDILYGTFTKQISSAASSVELIGYRLDGGVIWLCFLAGVKP